MASLISSFPYRLSLDYFVDYVHFGDKGREFYSRWFVEQLPKFSPWDANDNLLLVAINNRVNSLCYTCLGFAKEITGRGILLCTVVLLLAVAPLSFCVLSVSTTAVYFAVTRRQPHTAVVIAITGALGAIFAFFKLRTAFSGDMNFIPLGISFYTLREIHYVLESYKNKLPSRKFYDLICYLFFLPTFIVGPINRFNQFVRDLRRRRWNPSFFCTRIRTDPLRIL